MKEEDILTKALNEISPLEQAQIEAKMKLAAKLDDAIMGKGWTKIKLVEAMGLESVQTLDEWLSGTVSINIDILVELEQVLKVDLLDLNIQQNQS